MVTAADVAREVGVSRATVGFVLNETPGQTISHTVQERVRAAASAMGYEPSLHARALATGRTRIILVLLPQFPVEHAYREVLTEASAVLGDAGYAMVTTDPYRVSGFRPLWSTLKPDVVMAVEPLTIEQADAIRDSGVQRLWSPEALTVESQAGTALQVEHLVSRGKGALAFAATAVTGMKDLNTLRLNRARDAAAALGASFVSAEVDVTTAKTVVQEWVAQGVSGVAAFNDDCAAMVLGAALELGIRVPEELAIVGHDDTPLSALMFPSLSSVRVNIESLGRELGERALALASGKPFESSFSAEDLRLELVQRKST